MSDLRKSLIRLAHVNPEMRPHLLPLLKDASYRGVTVSIKDLPSAMQKPLKEIGYRRRDISVHTGTSYSTQYPADDGCKGFTCAINLGTGQYKVEWGNWGGGGLAARPNAVDSDRTQRPIPTNGAVLQGERCGNRPVYATLTVRPDAVAALIPEPVDLTRDEQKALKALGYKSGYRADEFWREGLGKYEVRNPLIQSLLEKGLIKANAGGAIRLTIKGKNAR